jgi:hypothetical protein
MNRRPPGLEIAKAIQAFVQFRQADEFSPRTIESYTRDLKMWLDFQGGHPTSKITPQDLQKYLTLMETEYEPRRLVGNNGVTYPLEIKRGFASLVHGKPPSFS